MYEVSGNLANLPGYENFQITIRKVYEIFIKYFGLEIMNRIDLYIDNAANIYGANCGYTPNATPIHRKYIIIKLGISNFYNTSIIIYQLSHELVHYVYYAKLGLSRNVDFENEEPICCAVSLVLIKMLMPNELESYVQSLNNETHDYYRNGIKYFEITDDLAIYRNHILFDKNLPFKGDIS